MIYFYYVIFTLIFVFVVDLLYNLKNFIFKKRGF